MENKFIILSLCVYLVLVSFNTSAALLGRLPATPGANDYQAYYDTDANLTWLADANANGPMNWMLANDWAANLDINGITGWRIPDSLQPDRSCYLQAGYISGGINCSGSELGNLLYNVFGGTAYVSLAISHNSNYDLFSNIQSGGYYWTATEYVLNINDAWSYNLYDLYQVNAEKRFNYFAWAVHDGDVAAIPVPAALWLFVSGFIGLIGLAICND